MLMTSTHPSIIALDLDGTLLTTDKRLTDRNRAALQSASDRGAYIVPATGRIFSGLPQVIRELPFLKYAILSNGASVYDVEKDAALYRAELPVPQALEIMVWLDDQPLIYDCYMDDRGWMTAEMYDRMADYAPDPRLIDYMRSIRTPVPDLKTLLRQNNRPIQKIQAFCRDVETQARLLQHLPFPGLSVSSSVARNVEINHAEANKGAALMALAKHLHIPREQVMAFGDGLNDLSMIRAAGTGVAMANAIPEVRTQADRVTLSNDADSVAAALDGFLLH